MPSDPCSKCVVSGGYYIGTVFNRGTKDAPVASLDEVSAAVGHSSPIVTKRVYDHYVRHSFSPKLRAGLGLGHKQQGGRIVSMKKAR